MRLDLAVHNFEPPPAGCWDVFGSRDPPLPCAQGARPEGGMLDG